MGGAAIELDKDVRNASDLAQCLSDAIKAARNSDQTVRDIASKIENSLTNISHIAQKLIKLHGELTDRMSSVQEYIGEAEISHRNTR